jgi:hypothetical protein
MGCRKCPGEARSGTRTLSTKTLSRPLIDTALPRTSLRSGPSRVRLHRRLDTRSGTPHLLRGESGGVSGVGRTRGVVITYPARSGAVRVTKGVVQPAGVGGGRARGLIHLVGGRLAIRVPLRGLHRLVALPTADDMPNPPTANRREQPRFSFDSLPVWRSQSSIFLGSVALAHWSSVIGLRLEWGCSHATAARPAHLRRPPSAIIPGGAEGSHEAPGKCLRCPSR